MESHISLTVFTLPVVHVVKARKIEGEFNDGLWIAVILM